MGIMAAWTVLCEQQKTRRRSAKAGSVATSAFVGNAARQHTGSAMFIFRAKNFGEDWIRRRLRRAWSEGTSRAPAKVPQGDQRDRGRFGFGPHRGCLNTSSTLQRIGRRWDHHAAILPQPCPPASIAPAGLRTRRTMACAPDAERAGRSDNLNRSVALHDTNKSPAEAGPS